MAVSNRCSLIPRAVKSHFTGQGTATAAVLPVGSSVGRRFGDGLPRNSLFAGTLTRFR